MTARADRARTWIEAFALGVLAALPVVPYLARLAKTGVPRFVVDGDYAGLELATRFAFSGRTLLGPYSRFGFNHPGPAYFFFLAPIYELCGETTTGIFVGVCLLNALAAFLLVAATRLVATRAHAVAAAIVVLAWMAAFGTATTLPWNPMAVVLPLLSFFALAAYFGIGRAGAGPPAIALGMLVAETHLATVPTVVAMSLAAAIGFFVARRRGVRSPNARRWLFVTAAIAVLLALPLVIEEATAREGNLTKLAHFFVERKEPAKPLREAFRAWLGTTTWLPDRAILQTITTEGEPKIMASEPIPDALPANAPKVACVWIVAMALAAFVARRRRDVASLALLGASALSTVTAILALRGIVGITYYYLLFWTTACSTLGWIGIGTTIASGLRLDRSWFAAAALVSGAYATSIQAKWLGKNHIAWEVPREDLKGLYAGLTARIRATGETPVIHPDAGWHLGLALLNELSKDGLDARVEEHDRWILGRQMRTPTGVANPLHVYSQTSYQPLRTARCLELLVKSYDMELHVAKTEVADCPSTSPP